MTDEAIARREAEAAFETLREANSARQVAWANGAAVSLLFRATELGGECGEVLNVCKKIERERQGWRGSRATVEDLADELADVVICADLLAMTEGIDLNAAIVRKFNATSEKVGLPHRISCHQSDQERIEALEAALTAIAWAHTGTPSGMQSVEAIREIARAALAAETQEQGA